MSNIEKNVKQPCTQVVWFCFFITNSCSKTMWRHFAYSCILVGREVNTMAMRVPYLWLKKRGARKAKIHQPWDEKPMLISVCVLSANTKTLQLPMFKSCVPMFTNWLEQTDVSRLVTIMHTSRLPTCTYGHEQNWYLHTSVTVIYTRWLVIYIMFSIHSPSNRFIWSQENKSIWKACM